MKATLIIVLVIFGLSTSANIRKISVNYPKSLLLAAFYRYQVNIPNNLINFFVYFIKERNSASYKYMNMPILVKFNNGSELRHDIECINEADEANEEAIYMCSDNNIINIEDIQTVTPIINFTFYNNNSSIDNKTVTENDIDISSFANTTIKNLTAFRDNIALDIFYLEKIILKNDEFILVGNLSNNDISTNISLTLSEKQYIASLTKDEIKFKPNENKDIIDDYLHGKMEVEEGINNLAYIIIYAEKGVDDHLIYPVSNNLEILGFGSYTKPTEDSDAYNQLYITGNQHILNSLEKYIKFNTSIYYNNSTNLEEVNTTIEANGTLIENNQTKNMAIYNITYFGTANKSIIISSNLLSSSISLS